jgi:hypothetical protein
MVYCVTETNLCPPGPEMWVLRVGRVSVATRRQDLQAGSAGRIDKQGEQGKQGEQSKQGEQGKQGEQSKQGEQGEQGITGEASQGVASESQASTRTI